jgi:hypothetical protein
VDRLTKRRIEAARVERFVEANPVIAKSKHQISERRRTVAHSSLHLAGPDSPEFKNIFECSGLCGLDLQLLGRPGRKRSS